MSRCYPLKVITVLIRGTHILNFEQADLRSDPLTFYPGSIFLRMKVRRDELRWSQVAGDDGGYSILLIK